MDAVEDEAAFAGHAIDHASDLASHLLWIAEGENLLAIDPAPESHAAAECLFQVLRLHALRGNLHGIDRIDADVDQVFDQGRDGAAAVQQHLGAALRPHRLDHARMMRLDQLAVDIGVEHGRHLGSQIVAEHDHVDIVADAVEGLFGEPNPEVRAHVHQAADEVPVFVEVL